MPEPNLTQIVAGGVVVIAVIQLLKLIFNFLIQFGKIKGNGASAHLRCIHSKEMQTAFSDQAVVGKAIENVAKRFDNFNEQNTRVHSAQGGVLKDILSESKKSNEHLETIAKNGSSK